MTSHEFSFLITIEIIVFFSSDVLSVEIRSRKRNYSSIRSTA